jgi:hypothetical protein
MRYFTALLIVPLGISCSDDQDHPETEVDPEAVICDHWDEARTAVDAGATTDDAPVLVPGDEPYQISLPAAGSGYRGFVTIQGPADVLLFMGQAAVASGLTSAGEDADQLPAPVPNEHCANDIPEHFDLELSEGDFHLELGPSTVSSLVAALVHADGHAHE